MKEIQAITFTGRSVPNRNNVITVGATNDVTIVGTTVDTILGGDTNQKLRFIYCVDSEIRKEVYVTPVQLLKYLGNDQMQIFLNLIIIGHLQHLKFCYEVDETTVNWLEVFLEEEKLIDNNVNGGDENGK